MLLASVRPATDNFLMGTALNPAVPHTSGRQQFAVIASATALLAIGVIYASSAASGRHAVLYLVGGALGFALYHALFGFTSAYRRFIVERREIGRASCRERV